MNLSLLVDKLDLEVLCGRDKLDSEVGRGYASDLLSDVIANSRAGDIWITLQVHQNVVAVASLNSLSGILLVNNRRPDEETVQKAEQEGIPILVTKMPAFEIIGRMYGLGIRGIDDAGGD